MTPENFAELSSPDTMELFIGLSLINEPDDTFAEWMDYIGLTRDCLLEVGYEKEEAEFEAAEVLFSRVSEYIARPNLTPLIHRLAIRNINNACWMIRASSQSLSSESGHAYTNPVLTSFYAHFSDYIEDWLKR